MKWTSALAIYFLFLALSLFVVLPFGIRNHAETGDPMVEGQSDGAPANFNARKLAINTVIVATIAFGLFYANYVEGWIQPDMINFFGKPPTPEG
jgi:predicted secreted protein